MSRTSTRGSVGVTFHAPSGQYKKTIGKQRGLDGRPRPKVFYLGSNQTEAKNRAVLLMGEWTRLQDDGAQFWPDGTTGAALVSANPISSRKSENLSGDGERVIGVVKLKTLGREAKGLTLSEACGDDRRIEHGAVGAADAAELRPTLSGVDQGGECSCVQFSTLVASVLVFVATREHGNGVGRQAPCSVEPAGESRDGDEVAVEGAVREAAVCLAVDEPLLDLGGVTTFVTAFQAGCI